MWGGDAGRQPLWLINVSIRLLDRHGEEALFDIFWEHNVNGIQDDDDVA